MIDWQDYKYKAFISYSHSDEKWARWLHRSLENYRIPKRLVGRETSMGKVPTNLAPIFRDREELASATDLGAKLTEALESSAVQIVICSMASAKSHWVNEEIKAFKRLGRSDRIFSLIVDGEPYASGQEGIDHYECFPPALRFKLGEDGELSDEPAEPIAADARHGKDGKANARVKLLAGLLGLGFDDLRQRELQRRNRRLAVISGSAVVGMLVAIGLATTAVIARNEAELQRNRAETEAETARQTASFLVSLFEVSDPSEARGRSITAYEILTAGAGRIETELAAQPEVQAQLMDTIGSVFTSLGLFDDARDLLQKALDNRRALPDVSEQEILESLLNTAKLMTIQADLEAAEILYMEAIERLENSGAQNSQEMADALAGLAELYYRMGRYEDAEPVLVSVLERRRQLLGADDPEVADAIEELGLNKFDQGEFDEAERYLRESLALRESIFGDQPHPDLAENLNNLGLLLMESGDYDGAEQRFLDAQAMFRQLYGQAHPNLAMESNNLGNLYRVRGDLEKAAEHYRQALDMNRVLFGEAHPSIGLVLNNLAFISYEAGDLAAAIASGKEALAMREQVLGRDHPDVALTMSTLGRWLTQSGDVEAAETLLRDALQLNSELLPPDHPDIAIAQMGLAQCLAVQEENAEALALAESSITTLAQAYGDSHWVTALAQSVKGGILANMGQNAEAETLLRAGYDILSHDDGVRPVYVEAAKERLRNLYLGTDRPKEAAAL